MVFETSLLSFSLPFCHAALELLIVPFGFFTSFSIPIACSYQLEAAL